VIAALFVQKNGAYYGIPDVDPWDEKRDARLYAGPWPVVAHPPCQLWVNFAALNFKRWGGEHNRPANDGGCFAAALASVRRWGGVLEHPASSNAWAAFDLRAPRGRGWQRLIDPNQLTSDEQPPVASEWVAEVCQSAYGHRARKRTWLYAVTPRPPPLDRRAPAGVCQVGHFDVVKPVLGPREASATPPAFRDLLLSIARSITVREAA
jgi:hypothetical protein